ncbi:MAG: hypothetical protein AB8B50_03320 [Pirellulaceae bacterium]
MTTVSLTANAPPLKLRSRFLQFLLLVACSLCNSIPAALGDEEQKKSSTDLAAGLIAVSDATGERIDALKLLGINTISLKVETSGEAHKAAIRRAANSVTAAGLAIAYWVEVARCPELADQHPQWMASLQTHDEWRRFFPDTPQPKANEVAKTYPWVPVLSRETFNAQRERVVDLLADLPTPALLFLNDLQGAPSACGCGNSLCRWTSDYGEQRTTVPISDEAAALFVDAIQKAVPESEVIPVWTTECELHDGHPDGLCAGVGCFKGICWKAYTRQLMPVAETSRRIGVLAIYKQFQRDLPIYGETEASWVGFAVKTFQDMPPRHNGQAVPASRIVAVVQGWDVSEQEIEAQKKAARKAGAKGVVVAFDKIEQSWSPKVVPWK